MARIPLPIPIFLLLIVIETVCGGFGGGQLENERYTPIFRPTPRNLTVGPGDRAVLKCQVENLGTKTVTWRRHGELHPLTVGLYTFSPDTRYSVDNNQRTGEWNLMIQDIKPEDEGTYQCTISTKNNDHNFYDILLNVKTVQVTGQEYVEKGEAVHLICNATGKPDPPHDVEWFKDGSPIMSDARAGILITKKIETKVLISVLVIKKSTLADAGDYVCRSSNKDAGAVTIHILNVAAPNVKRGTSQQKLASGGSTRLQQQQSTGTLCTIFLLLVTHVFTRWRFNT